MKLAGSGSIASVIWWQHCLRGMRNTCLLTHLTHLPCGNTVEQLSDPKRCLIQKSFKTSALSNPKYFQNQRALTLGIQVTIWSNFLLASLRYTTFSRFTPEKYPSFLSPVFSPCKKRTQKSSREALIYIWADGSINTMHKKIRIVDGNAECLHLKKLTCLEIFRQVFFCLRPRNPYPPLHTVYVCENRRTPVL